MVYCRSIFIQELTLAPLHLSILTIMHSAASPCGLAGPAIAQSFLRLVCELSCSEWTDLARLMAPIPKPDNERG